MYVCLCGYHTTVCVLPFDFLLSHKAIIVEITLKKLVRWVASLVDLMEFNSQRDFVGEQNPLAHEFCEIYQCC